MENENRQVIEPAPSTNQPNIDQPNSPENMPVPTISKSPDNILNQPSNQAQETSIKPRRRHYLTLIFIALILLTIFVPASSFGQFLGWPIALFGIAAGVMFLVSMVSTNKNRGTIVQLFGVMVGLGVGFCMFFACLIWGIAVSAAKNPNPPPPS